MKKQTVFVKRYIDKGELPKEGWVLTPSGAWLFISGIFKCPHDGTIQQGINEWLQEIELPSEEDVKQFIDEQPYYGLCNHEYHEGIEEGANFILKKLKGETKK